MKHPIEVEPRGSAILTSTKQLSPVEQRLKKTLEATIQQAEQGFMEEGKALIVIRDKKLYRDEYSDFDQYCRQKWNMSKQHAGRLMGAVEVCRDIESFGVLPRTERSIRSLHDLSTKRRRAVWKAVVKKAQTPEKVTGSLVAEIRQKMFKNGHSFKRDSNRYKLLVHKGNLIKDLEAWFNRTKAVHELAGKALLCKVIARIRRYE